MQRNSHPLTDDSLDDITRNDFLPHLKISNENKIKLYIYIYVY